MKPPFQIVHKNQNICFAKGFHSLERAEAWIANFDPNRMMDKTLRATDLKIVEDRY